MAMLDVKGSIQNLQTTVQNHYNYIKDQKQFTRAFPIEFELAYTDFRAIQMSLQLGGEQNHPLLAQFAATYEDVYKYEYAYATTNLEGFNQQFGNNMSDYESSVNTLETQLQQIEKLDQNVY